MSMDWAQGAAALVKFNNENAQVFHFGEALLQEVSGKVKYVMAATEGSEEDRITALSTLRILSRDNRLTDSVFNTEVVDKLCAISKLSTNSGPIEPQSTKAVLEAEKVLCNLIFHSVAIRDQCAANGTLQSLVKRMLTVGEVCRDIQHFDMRILFGMTALKADTRTFVREELAAIPPLCEILEKLQGDSSDYLSWALKVLYNLTVNMDEKDKQKNKDCFGRLVAVLRQLLLDMREDKQMVGEIINLLSNMSKTALQGILSPTIASDTKKFMHYNMEAVDILIDQLEHKLDTPHKKEFLVPVLLCLSEASRGSRVIRKYLKSRILPPLEDVMNRPEEGDTLRNKLVRLMTSPLTEVKCAAADLLFVLCKEKVGRLIKYTGYGNAAGLLASRGLMLGGRGQGQYSSESENSDTEEYTKYKDSINPVLGCYEAPKPHPIEGMTQEQKEYEAMQLVQLMDRLTRGGVVKPCSVGEDGKPHPVDHVLQLLEQRGDLDRDLTESEED
ncbi:synembryn-A-like isoform X2 [Varroa jacobsoni]|uniref:Synembryn-A n=1 Tax=Varroa destructor TaxID=109461 RepID=A0A7M7J7J2_VARDE|nr:synembryn-A-like isoform X2 [Varroa destructor]XP_022647939.1 synembryn-A-like isoform X2 [Varroa destructor]XP_022647940.1 synembryn-A-like isoform X2 [Varroa destructor]XP_022647941.1 synembryn-A-like isoform X2 [Varroa destructor]XP_022647942.1 synembryn-A-like isoform X2 [Varroa destructor]XP_022711808.1 synembryn-A-like isoform X2 [Varroa jacobsoni]